MGSKLRAMARRQRPTQHRGRPHVMPPYRSAPVEGEIGQTLYGRCTRCGHRAWSASAGCPAKEDQPLRADLVAEQDGRRFELKGLVAPEQGRLVLVFTHPRPKQTMVTVIGVADGEEPVIPAPDETTGQLDMRARPS